MKVRVRVCRCSYAVCKVSRLNTLISLVVPPVSINVRVYPNDEQKRADWEYQAFIRGDTIVPIVSNIRFPERSTVIVAPTLIGGFRRILPRKYFMWTCHLPKSFTKLKDKPFWSVLNVTRRSFGLATVIY